MKLLSSLVIGLVLLLPAPARAQSIKLTDLVGTWVGGRADSTGTTAKVTNDTLVFRADSTYRMLGIKQYERWHHLTGDTLSLGGGPGYKLTLKDQQLSWTGLGTNKGDNYIYKHVDTPPSNP